MKRIKIKFTEDYINGIINAVMIIKGAMSPHCYNVQIEVYDGQYHVLLKIGDTMEDSISLDTLQEIQYAMEHLFGEECNTQIKSDRVIFSIIKKDEY